VKPVTHYSPEHVLTISFLKTKTAVNFLENSYEESLINIDFSTDLTGVRGIVVVEALRYTSRTVPDLKR
jgi:hypothetical protein